MRLKVIALGLVFALTASALSNTSAASKSLSGKQLSKKNSGNAKDLGDFQLEKKPNTKPMDTQNNTKVDSRLIAADTKFGFKLYAQLAQQHADKNIFISPSSIAFALAMAYNGASGETKQAMMRTLELQGLTLAEVNAANAQLKIALENADPKVQLQIANSLWARQGVAFQTDFINANKDFYKAEVTALDFHKASAVQTINSWAKEKTRGKIEKIVEQINPDTLLFLINAIYFKGDWSQKFDATLTKQENFTLASGSKKLHPMMSQAGRYTYFESEKFQAVALPYGDKRINMYVFLPKANSSLADFYQSLNAESWANWMSQFRQRKGDIVLPKFKVEYETSLKASLKALGMSAAFNETADFSAMFQPPATAFISEVRHKAFAEVNEEGTEAAAVTSVEMRTTSLGPPPQTFQMVVDHPFFFAIRDNQTGAVLFMGAIAEPK